jgi:hypothetical protein
MLWRKAWLECRYRFLLCFVISLALGLGAIVQANSAKAKGLAVMLGLIGTVVGPIGSLILAGSGINTQTNWGMMHGFHPSMYFLLSMPVEREKLLRVRAALGLALTAVWLLLTVILTGAALQYGGIPQDWALTFRTMPNLFAGTLVYYALAVWLSAFLDEFWAGTISLTATGILAGYALAGGPSWFNMAEFMSSSGLINLDGAAWLQASAYLALSALFYWLAWRTVESKEY